MNTRTRRLFRGSAFVLALLALGCFCGAGIVRARHYSHASESVPGHFDYYLLSLSWSPAFCLASPGAAECNGPRRYGFIVHGLWPQNERGWPENCEARSQVPDDLVRDMADVMPARGLMYHEWSAHGTCSGLDPAAYFALVRRAYAGVVIPKALSDPTQALEESPAAVAAAFLQANLRLPAQSIVVTCTRQEVPRLREVHVCLDRNLAPRGCSADVLRGSCRASQLIVPPLH